MGNSYQITCTTQIPHTPQLGHIVSVGLANGSQTYTVEDIYRFMDNGHSFYVSDGRNSAWVRKFNCTYCGRPTLRSNPDASVANNLDNLPSC